MVKKLSFLIAGLFLLSAAAQAEEKGLFDGRAGFDIFGEITTYYKNQKDYHTPLDSATTGNRSGANNRSKQTTRTKGVVTFLGKAGKQYSENNSEFIAVFQLSVDADDPDHPDNLYDVSGDGTKMVDKDGERTVRLDNRDLWIRYSPMEPVGIKIGAQTIAATSAAAGIHRYAGDFDDDFIMYAASTILDQPGISIDVHLSRDFELGVALIEGMGDGSAIATGGNSSEAKNTLYWMKGKFWNFSFAVANQSIDVGGEEKEDDPEIKNWGQKYNHTYLSAYAKVEIGPFTPYLIHQAISGEDAKGADIEVTFNSVGFLAEIGPGVLAVDYMVSDTPELDGEILVTEQFAYQKKSKSVNAAIELDNALHVEYKLAIADGMTISFFYNALKSKEDSERKETEAEYKKYAIAIPASKDALNAAAAKFDSLEWTDTTSVGVQFQMKFAGL